ncbi:MAG: hypothetical protein DRO15_02985 [Thermoprotei archaeon]|nr:MAG: hypothetical protein DRO15_02985 [Thermoprotei archaeon]
MSMAEATGSRGFTWWISKLVESIVSGKKKIKKSLLEMASTLDSIKLKLETVLTRLEHRDKELFEMAVKAMVNGDRDRASIYAGEVLEVRKLMKNVRTVDLALEKVKIRLETLTTMEDIGVELPGVIALLEAVRPQLQVISPELAASVDKVIMEVNNIVITTQAPAPRTVESVMIATPEAEKVLKEVEKQAEKEIEEKLPKLPENLMKLAEEKKPLSIVLVKQSQKPAEKPKSSIQSIKKRSSRKILTLEELESKVLEYIIDHGGFIDVSHCASELEVSRDAVLMALESLKSKGKVKIT